MANTKQIHLSAANKKEGMFVPIMDSLYFGDITVMTSVHHSYGDLQSGENAEIYMLFPEGAPQSLPVRTLESKTVKLGEIHRLPEEDIIAAGYESAEAMTYDLLTRYDECDLDFEVNDDTTIYLINVESLLAEHLAYMRQAIVNKVHEMYEGYIDSHSIEFSFTRHVDEETGEERQNFDVMIDLPNVHNMRHDMEKWLGQFADDVTLSFYKGAVIFNITDDPASVHHRMKIHNSRQHDDALDVHVIPGNGFYTPKPQ